MPNVPILYIGNDRQNVGSASSIRGTPLATGGAFRRLTENAEPRRGPFVVGMFVEVAMPDRRTVALAALLALCAAIPAGASLADDSVCRRPCQFYVPQKGEADPTAFGCHDLIDNLSGLCGVSVWDLAGDDGVEITVHSHPRPASAPHHAGRQRLWIELG
jgi:hypothetical protein